MNNNKNLYFYKNPNSTIILTKAAETQKVAKVIQNLNNLIYLKPKGSQIPNLNSINYNFPATAAVETSSGCSSREVSLTQNVYKLLLYFFKSMYCLISKPVYISTPDKIKIQLFYFLCVPKLLTNNSETSSLAATAKAETLNSGLSQPYGQLRPGRENNKNYLALKNFNSKDLDVRLKLINLAAVAADPVSSGPVVASVQQTETAGQVKLALALPAAREAFPIMEASAEGQLKPGACNLTKIYSQKFKIICTILSRLFNKSVELELIRLHQPYYDSNILANFLALIINKKNISASIQKLYNSNIINCYKDSNLAFNAIEAAKTDKQSAAEADACLSAGPVAAAAILATAAAGNISGLNVKISGRLMREPIIPRVTTKKFDKGFTAKGKINYLDVAKFTHKNRKGAFTITVKSGQKFF